jgi:hypothetical protein
MLLSRSEQRMQLECAIDFHLPNVITREHGDNASSKLGETSIKEGQSGVRRYEQSLTYKKWKKQIARYAGSTILKTQDFVVQVAKNRWIFGPSLLFEGFWPKKNRGGGGWLFLTRLQLSEFQKKTQEMRGVSLVLIRVPHLETSYES